MMDGSRKTWFRWWDAITVPEKIYGDNRHFDRRLFVWSYQWRSGWGEGGDGSWENYMRSYTKNMKAITRLKINQIVGLS